MSGHPRRVTILSVVIMTLVAMTLVGGLVGSAQDRAFKPVTDAMLENPDSGDWINWRRTLDGWGYSPLTQINRNTAHQLQLIWSVMLGSGVSEPTPLVYNGLMYVPQAAGVVQAFNAATGDLVWTYTKRFEASPDIGLPSRMRSLAIYGDRIYVATPDAHIVALDASTGAVAWDRVVADYKLGYRYTSGPIVAKGRIVAGITGCERYKDDVCFVSAHDARTGNELWRVSTIARPGEPGGDTWGNLPLRLRAGGDAWIPGTYDPQANLVYWSVAQPKPWARISRGTDGDALFTNSTLAIDPETGKLVWYHQFLPGETHDQDEVFESVLIDIDGRSSIFKMGKLGILWEIDRKTGRFVAAHDLGYQNIVDVDARSGTVSYRPGMLPKPGVPLDFCPDVQGVRNWPATAYHPDMRALYIPIQLSCHRAVFSDRVEKDNVGNFSFYSKPSYTGYQPLSTFPHPASPEYGGGLIAMDINSGRVLWQHAMRTRPMAAALTTAGGLVVGSDSEGNLYLHDAETGRILFQTRLPSMVQGFPITYTVGGRQYLAVPVGAPQAALTRGVNALFVFAIPEQPGAGAR